MDKTYKTTVLYRPKSKWPYWVIYQHDMDTSQYFSGSYNHWLIRYNFKEQKIEVVCQRMWGKYTGINGKKYKREIGYLYKFAKEEDRLMFIMEQQQ